MIYVLVLRVGVSIRIREKSCSGKEGSSIHLRLLQTLHADQINFYQSQWDTLDSSYTKTPLPKKGKTVLWLIFIIKQKYLLPICSNETKQKVYENEFW